VRQGEIPYSPLAEAEKPSKPGVKDRVLSPEEVRQFWWGTDSVKFTGASAMVSGILKLTLATMQRPGEEVAGIRRDEIDTEKRLWIVPKVRTKNKIADHHVPLNEVAWEIIRERLRHTNGIYLFAIEDDLPPSNALVSTACGRIVKELGMTKFTPHDLRRTAA